MFSNLPPRYKSGFILGGLSLFLVFLLWFSSRSGGRLDMTLERETAFPPVITTTGAFSSGGSIATVLQRRSISPKESYAISQSLKKILDPRDIRGGDRYRVVQSTAGAFREIVITRDLKEYAVEFSSAGLLSAFVRAIPLTSEERSAGGVIDASLWESMTGRGINPNLIMTFANEVFAWSVDFNTEPRQGDKFGMIWESQKTPEGTEAGRRIIAAYYHGEKSGRHNAFLFKGEYYDENGHSLRKAFLHGPLEFGRISSRFGRRFHPLLRTWRKHPGTDYAAPRGTRVRAVGDGVVTFKGWKTVYGNNVEIRHNGTYSTGYGHFSKFAKGIRPGVRVSQGQTIGYVGSTGWATGPHVCFRVTANGRFVNFLKLKFPPDKNVPAALMTEFNELKRQRMEQLEKL